MLNEMYKLERTLYAELQTIVPAVVEIENSRAVFCGWSRTAEEDIK
jgi:hypothetical protein